MDFAKIQKPKAKLTIQLTAGRRIILTPELYHELLRHSQQPRIGSGKAMLPSMALLQRAPKSKGKDTFVFPRNVTDKGFVLFFSDALMINGTITVVYIDHNCAAIVSGYRLKSFLDEYSGKVNLDHPVEDYARRGEDFVETRGPSPE